MVWRLALDYIFIWQVSHISGFGVAREPDWIAKLRVYTSVVVTGFGSCPCSMFARNSADIITTAIQSAHIRCSEIIPQRGS